MCNKRSETIRGEMGIVEKYIQTKTATKMKITELIVKMVLGKVKREWFQKSENKHHVLDDH